ncbi:MAG: hypothetical protein Q9223_007013 [Gallowayella weberi]
MRCAVSIILSCVASTVLAFPTLQPRQQSDNHSHPTAATWNQGATNDFIIHESCNATKVTQLRKGLQDAVTLATHAKQHILRYGNSSEHYRKYFGDAPSGEAIGYYERIISGDRGDALFRCDDPDGNCKQPEWGGHWRGSNATNETVICDLSYSTRRPLEQLCALGYTVAGSETNTYFGSDLIHRLYHMPAFGENHVEHFAEDYAGALELAKTNATYATHDSDILQYFALDTYAYDIAVPGVGCPGEAKAASATETAPAMSSQTATATNAGTAPDAAAAAPKECHTHSDGTVHCT